MKYKKLISLLFVIYENIIYYYHIMEEQNNKDIEDIIQTNPNKTKKSQIISCSRRTDIPAFYMNNMVESMQKGFINVPNPMNTNQISTLSLKPQDVKCFVWWSKNYKNWIDQYKLNSNLFDQFKHMFNFTINGTNELEHIDSTLDERLEQLKWLALTFGADKIKYRFDPIVFYKKINQNEQNEDPNKEYNNLGDFEYIMKNITEVGVKDVIFAFCLPYKKVVNRMKKRGKLLIDLTIERQHAILDDLINITDKYGITLRSCCGTNLVGYKNKIFKAACVDGNKITEILDDLKIRKKDTGQRVECNCCNSRDIGAYNMICNHSCDYCYANPSK